MMSRFQPDNDFSANDPSLGSTDSESLDTSEQLFEASLEKTEPKFVLESAEPSAGESASSYTTDDGEAVKHAGTNQRSPSPEHVAAEPALNCTSDAWREQIAAKVHHYRARKPRSPRYPSLQLKFEAPDNNWAPSCTDAVSARSSKLATAPANPPEFREQLTEEIAPAIENEGGAKILEFPRSFSAPVPLDELAEPVFDKPRILEVPEVLPPPPALGGMMIEEEEAAAERRPGFELPLQAASLSRRVLASLVDAIIVLSAFAAFAYIFFRVTDTIPSIRLAAPVSAGFIALFWACYQYAFLVHGGTTPGLRLAKLRLSRFDGTPVPRKLRRWRVLASLLSGMSLALGYAWCFLDEDQLCWHDRITKTYMAPAGRP